MIMNDKLINHLVNELAEIKELLKVIADNSKPVSLRIAIQDDLMDYMKVQIDTLNFKKPLASRIINALHNNNITRVTHLLTETEYNLRRYPNMGEKCFQEVLRVINELGFEIPKGAYNDGRNK
jgi:DNA-directed RNA polymerase alpha subunit